MKNKFTKRAVSAAAVLSLAVALPVFAQGPAGSGGVPGGTFRFSAGQPGEGANASVQGRTETRFGQENGQAGLQNEAEIRTQTRERTASGSDQGLANRIQNNQDRGEKQIQARVEALNRLLTRVGTMKNLSDSQKSALSSTIQSAITDMTNLEAKIKADTTAAELSADLKTIAPEYRIYMLVMPQTSVLSAVDRINTLVASLKTIQSKIQSRVSSDSALSGNASVSASISDMTAKLSDALSQAAAAQAEVEALKPDQGDKAIMQSNDAALKDARAKIKTAIEDLQAARKDARDVIVLITGNNNIGDSSLMNSDTSASGTATGQ